jgi:hypothetical protein
VFSEEGEGLSCVSVRWKESIRHVNFFTGGRGDTRGAEMSVHDSWPTYNFYPAYLSGARIQYSSCLF